MSSRLALDRHGRRIAVQTTPDVGIDVGARFLVLGDGLRCGEPGFYWTGERTGRLNTVTTPRRTNRDPVPVEPGQVSAGHLDAVGAGR